MATTAEGVETKEQMDYARTEGCTEVQGFYICRPSPAAEIEKRILKKYINPATAA
jgi:EAL domain-containing protein (putative c-di-GMP-specific phosphodiesterase class I)